MAIRFLRGLQTKIDAASILDGQPAVVRRENKSPLLYIGIDGRAGTAKQIAPDVDVYGNTGITSTSPFSFNMGTAQFKSGSDTSLNIDSVNHVVTPGDTTRMWSLGTAENSFANIYIMGLMPPGDTNGVGNIGSHYTGLSRIHSNAYYLEQKDTGGSAYIFGRIKNVAVTEEADNDDIALAYWTPSDNGEKGTWMLGSRNIAVNTNIHGQNIYMESNENVRMKVYNQGDASLSTEIGYAYSGASSFSSLGDNDIYLGYTNHRWKAVYAINMYNGANNNRIPNFLHGTATPSSGGSNGDIYIVHA